MATKKLLLLLLLLAFSNYFPKLISHLYVIVYRLNINLYIVISQTHKLYSSFNACIWKSNFSLYGLEI